MGTLLSSRRIVGSIVVVGLLTVGSCRDLANPASTPETTAIKPSSASHSLVQCPTQPSQSGSAVIGLLGGTLSVGGTKVILPTGALLGASTIELKVPASPFVEIELTVNGQAHAQFLQPLVVTIDYSRCGGDATAQKTLTVWQIDTETKALLENMGAVDNKLTKSITFVTTHFSGYAVAD